MLRSVMWQTSWWCEQAYRYSCSLVKTTGHFTRRHKFNILPSDFINVFCTYQKNEVVGACSAYGGQERRVQGFGGEGDHLGVPGVDGRIILRCVFRK
jgi:hypothetical protein